MTIREQIQRLQALRQNLPTLSGDLMQDYADTAVALRKESSIDTGINRDGVENAKVQYSSKKVPSYLLTNKALNQAGQTYLKQNKLANWYGLRQAQGLPSKVVNLSYSGDTWKGYKVLSVSVQQGMASASIGLSNAELAKIFGYNIDRYGTFYRNTPSELVRLQENVDQTSHNWLTRYL